MVMPPPSSGHLEKCGRKDKNTKHCNSFYESQSNLNKQQKLALLFRVRQSVSGASIKVKETAATLRLIL